MSIGQNLGGLDSTGGEVRDETGVGSKKIVGAKFFGKDPSGLFERSGNQFRFANFHGEEKNLELLGRIRIFVNHATDGHGPAQRCSQLFSQFSGESGFGAFTLFHFPSGKFPFERRSVGAPPLADEQPAVGPLDNCGDYGSHARGYFDAIGQSVLLATPWSNF